MDIKRKELAIAEAHRQGFTSSLCPEDELDDDLGWGFLTGVEWADEHPKEGLVSIEKAAEWVKNAFKGTFGEGLAENIKQEFIETMTK
jgi:hypothetical protein